MKNGYDSDPDWDRFFEEQRRKFRIVGTTYAVAVSCLAGMAVIATNREKIEAGLEMVGYAMKAIGLVELFVK